MARTVDLNKFSAIAETLKPSTTTTSTGSTAAETAVGAGPSLTSAIADIGVGKLGDLASKATGGVSGLFSAAPGSGMEQFMFNSAPFENISAGGIAASPHAVAGLMPAAFMLGVNLMKANAENSWGVHTGNTFQSNPDWGMTEGESPQQNLTYKKHWQPGEGWTEYDDPVASGLSGLGGLGMAERPAYEADDEGSQIVPPEGTYNFAQGAETPFGTVRGQQTIVDAIVEMDRLLAEELSDEQIAQARDRLSDSWMTSSTFKEADQDSAIEAAMEVLTSRRNAIFEAAGIPIPEDASPASPSTTPTDISGLFDLQVTR